MKTNRNILVLLAIGGLAFALGHSHVLVGDGSDAWAQQPQENEADMEALVQAGAPSEHHEHLDSLVGKWDAVFKMWMSADAEPIVSQGTVTREWILGGRFLKETVEAESVWGTFQAIAYLGYNKLDGRYEFVWMEDLSTAMYFETGSFDPDKKILRTSGSHRDPFTRQLLTARGELDMSDPDRHVFVGYSIGPDGREYKSVEGTAVLSKE